MSFLCKQLFLICSSLVYSACAHLLPPSLQKQVSVISWLLFSIRLHDPPPTQCISLDIPAAAPSNINDNGELHVKNKSCIIAEEIHDIKNLALFLFDWNTQRKGTPQKCTRAILLPWFHWGLLPPALAFQPAAHGPTAIKGCGVQRKRKAFKVVFGVPALPSQQAADFLWD